MPKKAFKYPIDYVPQNSCLTFIKRVTSVGLSRAIYRCVCGVELEKDMNTVRSGNCISCGCKNDPKVRSIRHRLHKHPLYRIWQEIKSRCYSKNKPEYPRYGGVGVAMCKEWLDSPTPFVEWALKNGWKKGLEIDKDIIPKKLGIPAVLYSPEMCSVVTHSQNNRAKNNNVIVEYNGKSQTLAAWSEELGLKYKTLNSALKRNGRLDLDQYVKWNRLNLKILTIKGESKPIKEWAKQYGINPHRIYERILRGTMSDEEAVTRPLNYRNKIVSHTKNR